MKGRKNCRLKVRIAMGSRLKIKGKKDLLSSAIRGAKRLALDSRRLDSRSWRTGDLQSRSDRRQVSKKRKILSLLPRSILHHEITIYPRDARWKYILLINKNQKASFEKVIRKYHEFVELFTTPWRPVCSHIQLVSNKWAESGKVQSHILLLESRCRVWRHPVIYGHLRAADPTCFSPYEVPLRPLDGCKQRHNMNLPAQLTCSR